MRGSRAKRLRTTERPNPGRVHGGSINKAALRSRPRVRYVDPAERRAQRRARNAAFNGLFRVLMGGGRR